MRMIVASLILVGAISTLVFPAGDGLRVETEHRQFTLIGAGTGRDEFVFEIIDKASKNQKQAAPRAVQYPSRLVFHGRDGRGTGLGCPSPKS